MNRKLAMSLFLVANAAVVLNLAHHHLDCHPVAVTIADDGPQPRVPPKGPGTCLLIADRTQPAVPPTGPGTARLLPDGTQPAVPPKGPGRRWQTARSPLCHPSGREPAS